MIWTNFSDQMKVLMSVLQVRYQDDSVMQLIDGYYRHIGSWDEEDFRKATDALIASNKRPGVLPSVEQFREALRAIKAASGERYIPAIPNDKLATSTESVGMMRCINAILKCHRHGVVIDGEPLGPIRKSCRPMDIETWMENGRPETWSPLLDTLLESSYRLYRHVLSKGGSEYGRFLNEYADILEEKISEQAKEENKRKTKADNRNRRRRQETVENIF
jgi:hypothetical protein